MSTIPAKQSAAEGPLEGVAQRFHQLANIWRNQTAHISSTSELTAHPAFVEIVNMGPEIIPLLLRELEHRTGHWHRALRRITGVDPVPPDDRGNISKSAEAWLRWGKEHGYQC